MGISTDRIVGEVNSYFICSICTELFDDVIMLKECEHYFCRGCIEDWVKAKRGSAGPSGAKRVTCPECRIKFSPKSDLKPAGRLMRNLLGDVAMKCAFKACDEVVSYKDFGDHTDHCDFNPANKIQCPFCNETMLRKKSDHQCVKYLSYKLSEMELQTSQIIRNRWKT